MNELLPPHTPDEVKALRIDLEANGLQVPVVLDEHGDIIDGRMRAKLCGDLKFDWKVGADVRPGLSDVEKQALRIRLNVLRRHTPSTSEQRRDYRRILLMANSDLSDIQIAEMCGASRQAVQRDREELAQMGKLPTVTATVGRDGKRRTTKRPSRILVRSKREFDQCAADLALLAKSGQQLHGGLLEPRRIKRLANKARRKERIRGTSIQPLPENIQVHHCDFQQLAVEPGSVDLVMTDVLWTADAMPEWQALAELSAKWLKPNGLFASFIGNYVLASFIRSIQAGGLHYKWVFSIYFPPGGQSSQELVGITALWRPVVIFSPSDRPHDFGGTIDVIQGSGREKEFHEYQQNLDATRTIVERLSKPGDLVCDPCLGTGTTAVACMTAGSGARRFIGCDRDREMYDTARFRIGQELNGGGEEAA